MVPVALAKFLDNLLCRDYHRQWPQCRCTVASSDQVWCHCWIRCPSHVFCTDRAAIAGVIVCGGPDTFSYHSSSSGEEKCVPSQAQRSGYRSHNLSVCCSLRYILFTLWIEPTQGFILPPQHGNGIIFSAFYRLFSSSPLCWMDNSITVADSVHRRTSIYLNFLRYKLH